MKTKTIPAWQVRENKIKALVRAALDRYSADELFSTFYKVIDYSDKEVVNECVKDEIKYNGLIVLEIPSQEKQMKLRDFLTSEIYPYYNEQQALLFL